MNQYISDSIIKEERDKVCKCECCELKTSEFIVLTKKNICLVLSHLCDDCAAQITSARGDYDVVKCSRK